MRPRYLSGNTSYVSIVQVSTQTVTLPQFSSRLKRKVNVSPLYRNQIRLHYFTHILSSESILTYIGMYTHTSMWTHLHMHASTLTQTGINIYHEAKQGHQKVGARIFTYPSTLHTTASLSGQPLMMLKRDREGGSKTEGVTVKWWNILLLQMELRSSIFRQWRRDRGKCRGEGCKFQMQHVFKERNLHNFWQMIGRRGRGGKGEQGARRKQTWRK